MTIFPQALPHDAIERVAEGVHCVRGGFNMGPGVRIGRTMTILQGEDGLVILNAIRLTDEGQAGLDALGEVRHLVKLSDSHSLDEPFYADRYDLTVWALEGAKLNGLRQDRELGTEGPIPGGKVIAFETDGWLEAAYHVPLGGGTLVTCDVLQNCADSHGASFMGKLMMGAMGFKGGVIVPSMWRKFQKCTGPDLNKNLGPFAELDSENLVTGHGPPVVGGAQQHIRSAVRAVVPS